MNNSLEILEKKYDGRCLLTLKEAADELRISLKTLHNRGGIPVVRPGGGQPRVRVLDLARLLDGEPTTVAAPAPLAAPAPRKRKRGRPRKTEAQAQK